MIQALSGAMARKLAAAALCAGFVALAVFGIALAGHSGQGSLLSCVAASAGLVCDPHHPGASTYHDAAAYRAVTNSALSLYAALSIALAALALRALFAHASPFASAQVPGFAAAFSREGIPLAIPATARLRRWLSLFESSPGR